MTSSTVSPGPESRHRLRRRLARSRLARLVAFPERVRLVAKNDWPTIRSSATWLVRSREHTNFTYELTPRNIRYLEWFVASVTSRPVEEIREYFEELAGDTDLRRHIRERSLSGPRQGLSDPEARYGRRMGWYTFVRVLKPARVVETGTDKGLGSLVLAEALLRNGTGRLTTIDINPESGSLIGGRWDSVIDRELGDSQEILKAGSEPVGLFLHDSLHTHNYEYGEFCAVAPRLTDGGVVLSDNATETSALVDWAEERGYRFAFFQEQPRNHWYRGDGIGVAYR